MEKFIEHLILKFKKMSVRPSDIESSPSEAQRIAESMTTKEYFVSEECKLVDDWADKSVKLFKYALPHLDSQAKSSRASMKSKVQSLLSSLPKTTRACTTRVVNSLRHIASLTEK